MNDEINRLRERLLALADALQREADEADERCRMYRRLGQHPTADTWAGDAGAAGDAAARIRRALDEAVA